jgi:tetratricopeptide (TPR) repeat protein
VAVLLLLGAAAVYGYWMTRRERLYRDFIARGEAALARGDTATAIEAYTGAIAVKGDSMLGHLKRGEAHRRRNELEPAHSDLQRASALDPAAPLPLELLGDVSYEMGRAGVSNYDGRPADVNSARVRFERAAARYAAALHLDDRSPRVLYKLALSRYRLGQPGLAVEALQKAIALDERFAEAHYLLGLCYRDLQTLDASLRALRRSVALAPAFLHAREELADLFDRLGRGPDRILQLEALRALDPAPSREVALGLAFARASQSERAVLTLGNAAERYPDHPHIYAALGRVWLEAAQATRDRVALTKALGALDGAAGDDSSETLTLRARVLLVAGDQEQGQRMLEQATETFPADPLAFYFLAETAERRGRRDVARRALLDYQALEGDALDTRRRLALATRIADLSMQLGDAPMAVSFYQRAVDAAPADGALLARLAEAQWSAGDRDAARATLAQALEKDPTNRTARLLQRRIH